MKKKYDFNISVVFLLFLLILLFIIIYVSFYLFFNRKVLINFDANGGNYINSLQIKFNSKMENIPIPKRDGYKFVCWSLDGEECYANVKIKENIRCKEIRKWI